ncbi:6-phospho-3-hexuloisomerase [Oceanobacillus bengalensis]|uniref:6-phospho-3-hexuloisomerase n=1 Tax=Oceanobacillus bengalensis TaxID=1435466 RepID=A0A494YTX8_9BACI|nr:6-phospho-3-hexuloisomerase [Oceanobacillus bengalensis]RKQ13570.1 6-phospho-3-hexuloisomerase [Oceanobacillus bengalensis]
MKNIIETVAGEISGVLHQIDEKEATQLANELQSAKRIFIAGTGRSGLIGKVFAMRLMHSGYSVYVVGETITPSIETDDLLLLITGSGSTGSLVHYAKKAKEIDAKVALVTTNKDATIGQLADSTVTIPAATKKRLETEPATIQPLGSQFDQSAHLLLDAIVVYLLKQHPEGKSHTSLNQKHANLE